MRLNLCYIFPPAAVLCMWRPFSAMWLMFVMLFNWKGAQQIALAHYADYMGHKHVGTLTDATNNPAWTRSTQPRRDVETEPELIDNPYVGARGTRFKRKE